MDTTSNDDKAHTMEHLLRMNVRVLEAMERSLQVQVRTSRPYRHHNIWREHDRHQWPPILSIRKTNLTMYEGR